MKPEVSENQADIPTTRFEEVASLCEAFTGAYEGGTKPSMASYLGRAGADAQPWLLRNLLAVEIENRRAAGEQPQIEEYLASYPQFTTLIREVFLESSSPPSTVSCASAKEKAAGAPAVRRLGDYQLLSELGRGGMGVVFEAVHLRRGDHVALKTLPRLDGAALHRFKREFRSLADVNHPNLIGLHTLEADGGQWFFTMDLVEGVTFHKYVRPGGVLDENRLRAALSQLVTGVLALHGRHIIHRDLKPSNVMVAHDGRVIVLDFGLVVEQDHTGFLSQTGEKVAGTPAYMAPEQAAAGPITPACDWYAVGVMLYEALAGQLPFQGGAAQVLQDKMRLDAPHLPDGAAAPADLAALCLCLLARDPQRRPDAFAIAKAMAATVTPAPATTAHPGRQLVGRDQHLAALRDAFGALQRQRQPLTVFISGRSGEGKTTLADHFLAPLRGDQRLVVMSGRCYDRESVPFKALDTLIDSLSSYLRSLPGEDAALLMPDDVGALAQVFPVLQRVEVVAKASDSRLAGLDEQQVRQRAFRALRSLLSRVSRRALIVCFVDDLQWGDADSAAALFEVLRPPEAPAVLLLGAYRADETEGSAFLKMWKEVQRKHDVQFADREIKVGPLTVDECTELTIDLVGQDNEVVRRRAAELARETGGNPFLLIELIGCFDPDTDSFEPLSLHEVLDRKLGQLPAEAGQLLDVVAVSGQALLLEEAARTAGHELPPVATLTRMRNERLVRLLGPDDRPLVDTYHDRVRETVLGRMDEGRCRALHLKLAEVIENEGAGVSAERLAALESGEQEEADKANPRIYDLAYHFDAAGEKRKALTYALLAAEQARRQSALEVAVNNYAIAKRNAGETPNTIRYRIAEGYATALMLLGRYEEANEQLGGVVDLVEDAERKARIEGLQGELANKQGLLDKSNVYCEGGLRRLGIWVPQSALGLVYGVVRESWIQGLHCLLPFLRHRKARSSRLDLISRLFMRLTNSYVFQTTPKTIWAHLVGMNRAELLPPSSHLAVFYGHHACLLSMVIGWHTRQMRYLQRGLTMASEFDDLLAHGHCSNYQGISLCASARYEEALTRLHEAIDAFDKAGDVWQLNLARFHRGYCHFRLGNLSAAIAEARGVFASSARIGDSRTLCSSYLWARATRGNLSFQELKSCLPCRPDDIMSTVHGTMAEGYWHSFHGRTEESLHAFEQAATLVRQSFCMNFHTMAVLPALSGALRRHADVVQAADAQRSEALRRRAYRLAKWATRITRFFPTAYPEALRERSLILATYGKTWKALKFADKSCAVAEAQKAKYEHAQSLLVRGKLAKELGLPEADEQIRAAEAALDDLERPVREIAGYSPGPP